ncbi:MAG: hypothetical protein RL354_801 [Planctomycetota bacterium]
MDSARSVPRRAGYTRPLMQAEFSTPVRAFPIGGLTFLCSLGTGILWNALYFIAESEYGFSERDSLLLAFVNGILYTAVAVNAGRVVGFLEGRLSPRAALGAVLLVQALLAPLVLIPNLTLLWFAAVAMTALGALQWPIVQHYLASGRHGREMRNAIGWWNASWMAATAIGLALAGPLESLGLMRWAIPSLLLTNAGAIAFLAAFPKHPPSHDPDTHAMHVPPSYRSLLGAARVLHPMGYLVIGALSPILPYLFNAIGTDEAVQAPISATWHVARFVAVLILWRTAFWHGRASTLVVAGLLLSLGFALAVAAPSERLLIVGLAALGLGQGTIYYSAIYYGLAVGGAKVEAGGMHEALVGAGYFIGPALGLLSLSAGLGTPVFIGMVLGALAVGFFGAVWRAGRANSQSIA